MAKQPQRRRATGRTLAPYVSEEMHEIMQLVEQETGDSGLSQGLQFSPTALTHIRRTLAAGGTIVTDTALIAYGIDMTLLEGYNAKVKCFVEDPQVVQLAEIRNTTRAEVAVDIALALQGPKLMVIGSAPTALNRVLIRRQHEPLSDVCVLAAPGGFASVVQLKEKLRDSDMAFIVERGKKGGATQTMAILNAILKVIRRDD